jgi:hypothetical protein
MTESEWESCDDPDRLLSFLVGKASWRKALLLSCGCFRRQLRFLPGHAGPALLLMFERYADGLVTDSWLREACAQSPGVLTAPSSRQAIRPGRRTGWHPAIPTRRPGTPEGGATAAEWSPAPGDNGDGDVPVSRRPAVTR